MTVCSMDQARRLFSAHLAPALSALILLAGLIGAAAPGAAAGDDPDPCAEPVGVADSAPAIAQDGGAGVPYAQVQILSVSVPGADGAGRDGDSSLAISRPDRIGRLQEITDDARYQGVVLSAIGDGGAATPTLGAGHLGITDGFRVDKALQVIVVTAAAPPTAVYSSTFDVAAVASSGLAVTINTSGVCTGSGRGSATVVMTSGTGTCRVHYNQAGDGNFNAAPEATSATTATRVDQTVSPTAPYGSVFDLTAVASSGLAAAITASGACTGGGEGSARIVMTSGTGICTVHYNQAGNANYSAASEVTYDIAATRADQSMRVTGPVPETAAYASTFDVKATASSNLPVAITASGVCTGRGSGSAAIRITSGSGICTLHFNQAGDSNFHSATELTEVVIAEKATLTVRPNPYTASRQYSDGNPLFVPAYSGLAAGDDVGELTEEPTCSTTAGPASAPGSYPVTCIGGAASNYSFSYDDGAALAVTEEEALVEFSRDNLVAVRARSRGKYTEKLRLTVLVKERQPDTAANEAAAGDIDSAALTVTLSPLSAGGVTRLNCKSAPVPATGYGAVKTFTCTTNVNLGVDVYDLSAQVTGNYTGVGYDGITVYGRGPGYVNGGGWFHWPGTEDKTNFGFVMKNGKGSTDPQGNLLVVRHHSDGTISRIKSSSLTGLVLQDDAMTGCGNATFSGKATYTAWNPSAVLAPGGYVSTDGNPFMAYAEDCNNPGTGPDHFLVRGVGQIQMPTDVYVSKVPLAADRGDIVLPHKAGKKK